MLTPELTESLREKRAELDEALRVLVPDFIAMSKAMVAALEGFEAEAKAKLPEIDDIAQGNRHYLSMKSTLTEIVQALQFARASLARNEALIKDPPLAPTLLAPAPAPLPPVSLN